MIEIEKEEFEYIEGGLNVSGTLINSLTAGIKIILELGRSLGSSLRRLNDGKFCSS